MVRKTFERVKKEAIKTEEIINNTSLAKNISKRKGGKKIIKITFWSIFGLSMIVLPPGTVIASAAVLTIGKKIIGARKNKSNY